ncbi:MAG: glycoside hydrolase family 78 protein, partial [Terriglobales bacterium]
MTKLPDVTRRELLEAAAAILAEQPLRAATGNHAIPSWRVSHLRCEYADNPLGIDILRPRLSWRLEAAHGSVKQAA